MFRHVATCVGPCTLVPDGARPIELPPDWVWEFITVDIIPCYLWFASPHGRFLGISVVS